MRSLEVRAEINAIDSRIVTSQRVVSCRFRRAHGPNLDGLVEGSGGEHGRVLGVDLDHHNVMVMVDKRVNFGPILVPVKHAD